jgi:eukaryotic-like serine/threonine-protein kinase
MISTIHNKPALATSREDDLGLLGPVGDSGFIAYDEKASVSGRLTAVELHAGGFPFVPGYKIIKELGRGGMGVVYEAEDTRLHRLVALKLICQDVSSAPGYVERMQDEAEAVARMHHPNVVQIYEILEHRGLPILAFELVSGGSLADFLKAGTLKVDLAVGLVRAIAEGVRHVHQHGVIHRDLKPANILLELTEDPAKSGQLPFNPKVTDFGLAKLVDRDFGRTQSGMMLGTLYYMAPEVIDHAGAVSPASDVYSLGVVLFECLTGRVPLRGKSFLETVRTVMQDTPPSLCDFLKGNIQKLDAICQKALEKRPQDRYHSVQEFIEDLDRYMTGHRVRANQPEPKRLVKRYLRPVLAAMAVMGLALAYEYYQKYASAAESVASIQQFCTRREFADAEELASQALQKIHALPYAGSLDATLNQLRADARRGQAALELHKFLDRIRFEYNLDSRSPSDIQASLTACDSLWCIREQLQAHKTSRLDTQVEEQLRTDLLDLVIISVDLKSRLAEYDPAAKTHALERLSEAEELVGSSPVMDRLRSQVESENRFCSTAIDPDMTTWEIYAIGRTQLLAGDAVGAMAIFQQALKREPRAFWPNYYEGLAALRCDQAEDAVSGFSVCIAYTTEWKGLCYYHRALAYESLGKLRSAERDLDSAIELEPKFALAYYRRGIVRLTLGKIDAANEDLEKARALGYAKADLWYQLAFARNAMKDHPGALGAANEAVRAEPSNVRYRDVLNALQTNPVLSLPATTSRSSP